jgi:DNA-binding CsgD family transcriptional regulator
MAPTIRESDRERVLETAWSLGGIRDEDELSSAAMAVALTYFGGDEAGYNDISLAGGRFTAKIFPVSPLGEKIRGALGEVIREHPVVRRLEQHPTTTPLRMSDLVPNGGFRRTKTYEMIFRPRGLEHQLTLPLRVDPARRSGTVYVVNRSHRDFDEHDLSRALLLQPVLAALHAAARARVPSPEQREAARRKAGLTPRELEMLGLAASGMTADAIGRARAISVRTVHKHLENAYLKLGARGRLQAVETCRRTGLLD